MWRMRIACWITKCYKHTPTICNTYCFSSATVVARTRLHVTLYVHCLSLCVCLEVVRLGKFLVNTALQTSNIAHDDCDKFPCLLLASSFCIVLLIIDLPQYTACTSRESFPCIAMQICEGWPQRGRHTLLVRFAQVAYTKHKLRIQSNIQVVYLHTWPRVKSVVREFVKKGDS